MAHVTFFAHGTPRPQGSMRSFKHPKTGAIVTTSQIKGLKPWRKTVAQVAAVALGGRWIYNGVSMTLVFSFERPKAHYRTGRYSHLLRDDAPERHQQDPDIDKLERAILDALTGVAFKDDNEVDTVGKQKRWCPRGSGEEGAIITLRGVFHAVQR